MLEAIPAPSALRRGRPTPGRPIARRASSPRTRRLQTTALTRVGRERGDQRRPRRPVRLKEALAREEGEITKDPGALPRR